MVIGDSLRGTLAMYCPTWLANVPGLRRLFSVVWTLADLGDALREWALEGQLAAYPGVGTPTANSYLAASRGLLQGPAETDDLFAKRLLSFREDVKAMGSAEARARELQAFLVGQGSLGAGVYPMVRCIDRAGRAVTLDANRNATYSTVAWNWDEAGGWVDAFGYQAPAVVEGYWSDVWVVIQDPFPHWDSFSNPAWIAAWNSGDSTFDGICSQAVVSGVQSLCETWKGAHIYVRCVIWCPDPTTFIPDGHYGNSSRNVAGTQIASRATSSGGNPAFSYWSEEALG